MKPFPAYGRESFDIEGFVQRMRCLMVGRIYSGWFKPKDRLPSIRDVARQQKVDHRVVAQAYRTLAEEGLVEIRPQTGVFAALPAANGSEGEGPTAWTARILLEAWEKRISRSTLCTMLGGDLVQPLRCGCIESNEDEMVALTAELEEGLSLEVVPLFVDPHAGRETPAPAGLEDVDVLVASVFHADFARRIADAAGKPLVVLTLRREFTAEIGRRLDDGPVTAVVVDPRYAERGRAFLAPTLHRDAVRYRLVDDLAARPVDLSSDKVMITRAARRRLGLPDFHLVRTPRNLVSLESAGELCRVVAIMSHEKSERGALVS